MAGRLKASKRKRFGTSDSPQKHTSMINTLLYVVILKRP
jgi:hypothetical protein